MRIRFFLFLLHWGRIFAQQEVIVEAKKEKSFGEAYAQKVSLKGRESYGAANVSEILERQNGVYLNRYGPPGTHSHLFLRGQNPENAGIYFEGILLNDIYGGSFNLENLPFFLFESVEIYPTSPTVELPGSFAAGALDLRLIMPQKRRVWLTSSLHSLQGGTMGAGFENENQLHYAEISGSENRYVYQEDASLYYKQNQEKKIRKNEDFFQGGYTALLKKKWQEDELTLWGDVFLKERGLPGTVGLPTEKVRLENQRFLMALKYSTPILNSFFWQNQLFSNYQSQNLKDPLGELATGFRENLRSTLSTGLSSSVQFFQKIFKVRGDVFFTYHHLWQNQEDFAKRIEFEVGLLGELRPYEKYMRILLLGKAHFLKDVPFLKRGGLISFQKREGVQENLLAHLGFFPLDFTNLKNLNWEISTSAFRGGRFPSLAENYGDGATLLPASNLEQEKSLTYSASSTFSYSRQSLGFSLKLGYFWTESKNLILFIHNSQQTMVATNAGLAKIKGWETEASFSFLTYLKLIGRYQYLDAHDWGMVAYYHGKYLPYRPRHKAVLSMDGGTSYVRFFGGFDFIGRNFRDRYNSPYSFLKSRWRFFSGFVYYPKGNYTEEFRYTIRNIFNESQVDVLGYPLPGQVHEIRYTRVWEGI